MKNIKSALFAAALVTVSHSAFAATNLVVNGGFESNTVVNTAQGFDNYTSGLSGWTIGVGNVDLVTTPVWDVYEGSNSLDLNGTRKSEISQVLNTVAGQQYQLSFWLSGNPQTGDAIKQLSVNVGSHGLYQFNTTGMTAGNLGWTNYVTSFFAVNNSTTLSFASNTRGAGGPLLDSISVSAVPEADTYSMMLLGLGLIGFIASRRRSA